MDEEVVKTEEVSEESKLIQEKVDLVNKYNRTRNTIEKAEYIGKIKLIDSKLEELKNNKAKEAVVDKEAPVVVDHKSNNFGRGDIVYSGNAFRALM